MNNKEFAAWVDSEGGIFEAYNHGFDIDELKDQKTRVILQELWDIFAKVEPLTDKLYERGALL